MDENTANNRRRRGAGIVTPNACTECRKKRAKCDGATPCQRCVTQSTECIYEIPVRQSKETMRAEIDQLQTYRRQTERLFSHIASHSKVDEILNRLRNGDSLELVSEWLEQTLNRNAGGSQHVTTYESPSRLDAIRGTLRLAESVGSATTDRNPWPAWQSNGHSSIPFDFSPTHSHGTDAMNWTMDSQEQEQEDSPSLACPRVPTATRNSASLSPETMMARDIGTNQMIGPSFGRPNEPSAVHAAEVSWTNVTSSSDLIEHLMALYFCWEYPTFASLSKEHFVTDFRAGRPSYCSSLLVNTMLALGCRFSKLPEAFANPNDPDTSGDHFFAEAKRLLAEDDMLSLTTVQALGLLSIREASCGRDTESLFYAGQAIKLASEFGLHLEADHSTDAGGMEREVRSATFWGAFALDEAWCLCLGRLPHFSRSATMIAKPSILEEVERSEWIPYSDNGAPTTKSANQPSNVRTVFRCFAELSELVHQSLYTLYTPGKRTTSNDVVSIYFRHLNWYSALPEPLRLGRNFTPAVLFAHMYYHFAILLLLRPFIKLRFIGSSVSPRDVCAQAAEAITTLLRSYDQLYTLERTPSFVPYIVLASSMMHLVNGILTGNASPTRQIHQSVSDLKSMSSSHGFAKRGLDIVHFLTRHWNVGVENNLETRPRYTARSPPMDSNGQVDNIDSVTNEDMRQTTDKCSPNSKSNNLFCPEMGENFQNLGPRGKSALFSPFPMQGLPLVASDDGLEANGFERIIRIKDEF